eukprot:jgi/Tetstr1/433795/TSEL_002421.t1
MAASSTAQPPGVVKTLADGKKRKRPVKKRRGKKLIVAELESEAEAEAARSSKRRTSPPGQKWAASLVVSRVRAAGIEEDEKDMRKRVTRHRGRPDAKVRKLMAASSTAQPPGMVKTLTDDKKRKRPVKKRRGKKLTVAESEAESEAHAQAEAEAEAARSSKRRVPRARKNTNKQ